jgi:cytoskeleton protein RodZ
MAAVSEQLRRAREAQQLDVYQVAEITKIKTDHVRALESGDFNVFSAPVYIRGFVRTYATMLKLDVPRVLADLDSELGRTTKFREPPPLVQKPRGVLDFLTLHLSRLDWRIAVAAVALLLFLVLAVVIVRSRTRVPANPLKDLGPGLHQPQGEAGGEKIPLPAR